MPAHEIDHVLYAAPTLDQGMDEIEQILGVRPAIGGRHPGFGTHNALLSLGSDVYLEVIARDPTLPPPDRGILVDLEPGSAGRLMTWVLRVPDIDKTAAAAVRDGLAIGDVDGGERKTPDGETVRWRLTDPYAERMQGAVPFLIDWGDTSHPARRVPVGGRLTDFVITHPDVDAVSDAMTVLGATVDVREASAFRLIATIETPGGVRTLS